MGIKDIFNIIPSVKYGRDNLEEQYNSRKKIDKKFQMLEQKDDFLFWLEQNRDGETLEETKRRVFSNMPVISTEIRELQMAENYILRFIKNICDANNLEFFLMGGTLLGAYRHKGFIPWDDDIDLGMMENEAECLKSIINESKEFNMQRYYQPKYGGTVYKVKINGFESPFVDIFPFQLLNCSEKDKEICWEETQDITNRYIETIRSTFLKEHKDLLDSNKPVYNEELDKKLTSEYHKMISNCEYLGTNGEYFAESIQNGNYRKSRKLFEYKKSYPLLKNYLEFEGEKYSVWADYKGRLETFYGDIWGIPNNVLKNHSAELDDSIECIKYLKDKGEI